ncbi:CinA family protein [Herminiimonas contaminans]|uniref:CinA family protein n=1 Tax=Herminiimonas contaminans TaxID=1111140 RepID=A0ABS0EWR3_9BURK|nr:CinA family protein [Herminiimonas contaminans]MBF8179286.1 CinA family protein [Herminiimonas contaminans]
MQNLIELATEVGQRLKELGLMLATAESCTGGGVAQAITEIAGSSDWFECGFVTYSNEAKIAMLKVPEEVLARHGAVSNETAQAMAQGAIANSRATIALSTTGIAGPGGGVPGKPVGMVCFGWAWGDEVHVDHMLFSGDRHAVREQSVEHALQGLLNFLATNTAK